MGSIPREHTEKKMLWITVKCYERLFPYNDKSKASWKLGHPSDSRAESTAVSTMKQLWDEEVCRLNEQQAVDWWGLTQMNEVNLKATVWSGFPGVGGDWKSIYHKLVCRESPDIYLCMILRSWWLPNRNRYNHMRGDIVAHKIQV